MTQAKESRPGSATEATRNSFTVPAIVPQVRGVIEVDLSVIPDDAARRARDVYDDGNRGSADHDIRTTLWDALADAPEGCDAIIRIGGPFWSFAPGTFDRIGSVTIVDDDVRLVGQWVRALRGGDDL